MLPGPTIIRRCPHCEGQVRQSTWASGNTFGARFWTDGKAVGSMLPDETPLAKCPHCCRLIWLPDAEEVDRIDHLLIGRLRQAPPSYRWKCLEIPDARPWWKRMLGIGEPEPTTDLGVEEVDVGKLSEEELEQIVQERELKAELLARAEELKANSLYALEPEESDYLSFASEDGRSSAHIRHARIRAWWRANDALRDDDADVLNFRLSGAQAENLERLYELLDEASDNDRLMKAEVARELGRFDRALSLLTGSFPAQMQSSVETIRALCHERNVLVAEIPGRSWSRGGK